MIDNPGILLTLIAFALVLGPLVFLHELGHYLAGRWFGVKADEFSIGFGREIMGFTDRRGTRWKFGWLPLGGYVRFAGDGGLASEPSSEWLALPAEERGRTLQAKPVWQRAIVVAAGPVANFLVAVTILAGFSFFYGVDRTPATVGIVTAASPAAKAGLQTGDRIVSIDGRVVATFEELAQFTVMRPEQRVHVELVRDGEPRTFDVMIGVAHERDRFGHDYRIGRLGIGSGPRVYERVGLLEAPWQGIRLTALTVRQTLDGIGQIVTGRRSVDELGGPLKIAQISGEQLWLGPAALVWFIAMISINLGFINLLPVPMLDGGHLFFYAIEAVRRRPLNAQAVEWAFRGGLVAILTLMLLVTFNDLGSFGVWKNLAGLIG